MASDSEKHSLRSEDERYSTDVDRKYSEEDMPVELSELEPREYQEDRGLLNNLEKDVEAQNPQTTSADTSTPVEYTVSTGRKLAFLGVYFVLNLSLTLSNKALLNHASYPWMLTFAHTTATSIGCAILLALGQMKLTKLSLQDNLKLVAFSILFTLNIAVSNVSL